MRPTFVEAHALRPRVRVHHDAVADIEGRRVFLQHDSRRLQNLAPQRTARLGHGLAADSGRARCPRAAPVGRVLGVAGGDLETFGRDPHRGRRDLRDHRLHPLTLLGRARRDEHVAPGVEPHRRPVLRRDPRASDPVEHRRRIRDLDEAGNADAAVDSALAQSVTFRLERFVVHRFQKPGQAFMVGKVLERQSLRRLAGVRIVRPEVSATELDGVHAEPAGRRIDQSLGGRALDRVPDRAVLAHHVLVLEDDRRHRPIVVERIGAAHQVDDLVRFDTARARIHGIGADTAQGVDLEGKDGTVVPDRDLAGHPLVTRVNVGNEALHAVRDELDRPFEQHGEPGGRDSRRRRCAP